MPWIHHPRCRSCSPSSPTKALILNFFLSHQEEFKTDLEQLSEITEDKPVNEVRVWISLRGYKVMHYHKPRGWFSSSSAEMMLSSVMFGFIKCIQCIQDLWILSRWMPLLLLREMSSSPSLSSLYLIFLVRNQSKKIRSIEHERTSVSCLCFFQSVKFYNVVKGNVMPDEVRLVSVN